MKTSYRQNHEVDRAEWDEFVTQSPQGAIYSLSGCLDALAPGWSLLEVRDGSGLLAGLPLHLKKKGGFTASIQAPFTQYWGILFRNQTHTSPYKEYQAKNQLLKNLLDGMPKIDWFAHGFSPEFDYPQPLHHAGHTLNTRYTWVIDLSQDEEQLLASMRKTTRNLVRNSPAEIKRSENIDCLTGLIQQNRKEGKNLISQAEETFLQKFADWLLKSGHGWVLRAETEGKIVGSALFATFKNRTVYLMSAKYPGHDRVMSRLLWQAMLKAKRTSCIFDFEGSMIEGIEQFFRGFGPRPIPYLFIEHNQIPQIFRWIKNSL